MTWLPVAFLPPPANNTYGAAPSIAPAAIGTLVNIPSSSAGFKVVGFTVTGNGDGYFFLEIGGLTTLSGRIDNINRTCTVTLPNPIQVSTGTQIALKVTNEASATADFEGTLFGT